MRMSFESIRPGLASRSTPRVTLAGPPPIHHCHKLLPIHHRHKLPPIHHYHSPPRRRIRSVLPLSLRTRCLTSQLVLRPTGMRPRTTESSSARMWRPSELTCSQSWPTKRPSSVISSPYRTSSPRSSPSSSHRRHLRSDPIDHQGSFLHPLSFFHRHWGQCPHLFGGMWVIGFGDIGLFWCLCFFFLSYTCDFLL